MADGQVLHRRRRAADRRALQQRLYTEVLDAYGSGLARVVGAYARRPEDREDLRQEFALALWRALARYRGDASLKTFAYRIATNLSVSYLRRHRRVEPIEEAPDGARSPEEELGRVDERERLRRAIGMLPLNLRQVVLLRLEGMSYAEVGAVLGLTEKNVSVRLSRARSRLRQQLGRQP